MVHGICDPWFAKHNMSEDVFSQKNGRSMYLQGTVMHLFSIGKCTGNGEMLKNYRPLNPHFALKLIQVMAFYVFLMKQKLGCQTVAK